MATDVDAVYTDFGHAGPEADRAHDAGGVAALKLPAGSMGPKVEAAVTFVRKTASAPRSARSPSCASVVAGTKGTQIDGRVS